MPVVITGSEDGTAKLWSFGDPDGARAGSLHAELVTNFQDGAEPPVIHGDGRITRHTWHGHTAGISSVQLRPVTDNAGDERLLTSSKDKLAKVWHLDGIHDTSLPPPPVVEDHEHLARTKPFLYAKMKREGKFAEVLDPERGHDAGLTMAAWSPQGDPILTCSLDKKAMLWDYDVESRAQKPPDRRLLHTLHDPLKGHTLGVSMGAFSRDGNRILTCSHDMSCIIWEARSGKCTKTVPGGGKKKDDQHQAAIWSACWSPEGSEILTASKDMTAKVWDTATAAQTACLRGHSDFVLKASYSEDGNQVLTCSMDSTAKIWDARASSAYVFTLGAHDQCVWEAHFANVDQNMILTVSHDMTALVFDQRKASQDAALCKPLIVMAGHTGILWQGMWSPNDSWVITCSEDRTARAWYLKDGSQRPLAVEMGSTREGHHGRGEGHKLAVSCAAYHGDGRWSRPKRPMFEHAVIGDDFKERFDKDGSKS